MVNTRKTSAPFVVISLMGILLSTGCSFTLTSAPTPTRIPESRLPTATTTPTEGAIQTEGSAEVLPPEGLDNLEPFAAENAAGLFEVNSLNVGAPVVGVFFAQEGRGYSLWMAVWDDANRSSRLEHWDLYTGRVIGDLASGELLAPKSLSGTADGRWLVTADESNVEIWDVFSGRPLVFDFEPSPWLAEIAVAPTSNFILAVGYASVDGTVVLIDMVSNQTISVFRHGDYVSDIDFTSDGRYLASGAADGSLMIVDIQKLEETSPFRETGWVDSLALELSPPGASAKGPLLATSVSGAITLWDVAAGALLQPLAGQAGIVESMDFSPNGEILASGGRFGAVVLWNTITGEAISALQPDFGGIAQLAFSSDGTLLVAATQDGYVLIWAAGP